MIKNINKLAIFLTIFAISGVSAEEILPQAQRAMENPLSDRSAPGEQRKANRQAMIDELNKNPMMKQYVMDNVPENVSAELGLLPQSKPDQQGIKPMKASDQYLLFISTSLGDAALNQIFASIEGDAEVTAVLRGVTDPDNSGKELLALQEKISQYKKGLNLIVNPKYFRDYGIKTVPVLVKVDADGEEVARVAGMTSREWLAESIKSHPEVKDFGVRGQIEQITERDLAEVMREKALAVDWESRKRKAVDNVWKKYNFVELPHSAVPRTREIDLTVRSPQTIKDQYGKVLYKKGDLVNPLALKYFDRAVIVFNPSYESELKTVKKFIEKHKPDNRKTRLIVTHFDRKKGGEHFNELQEYINSRIYVLNEDLRRTFTVEYTPAIIYADGGKLYITEFGDELTDQEKLLDWRAK